jgi:hypothetical protein
LALNGISLLPAGEKFLLLFPTGTWQAEQASNLVARLKPPAVTTNEPIAAGALRFMGAPLEQLARVYQDLRGQPVEVASSTPAPGMLFENQTPLSKEAAAYGLELLFGVNGLSVVPKEDNSAGLKIVPTSVSKRR